MGIFFVRVVFRGVKLLRNILAGSYNKKTNLDQFYIVFWWLRRPGSSSMLERLIVVMFGRFGLEINFFDIFILQKIHGLTQLSGRNLVHTLKNLVSHWYGLGTFQHISIRDFR